MRSSGLSKPAVVAVWAMAFLVVLGTGSNAAPTHIDLSAARARLDALNRRLQIADEAYNQSIIHLAETKRRLKILQRHLDSAQKTVDQARRVVSAASADAYIQGPNTTMAIMSATDVGALADRLDFLESVASRNTDLAQRASVAGLRASQIQHRLRSILAVENASLRDLGSMRAELQRGVAQAETLLRQINAATSSRSSLDVVSRSFVRAPHAPGIGAQKALNAAYSVLGTPYRYAGASPQEGFDCSGLTMWAWAHAGVSLPHSAQDQYNSLPHVSRSELQPGDLVFFYQPISHVGMYVGNGRMIEAPHPGDHVKIIGVYWDSYVGGARPGV